MGRGVIRRRQQTIEPCRISERPAGKAAGPYLPQSAQRSQREAKHGQTPDGRAGSGGRSPLQGLRHFGRAGNPRPCPTIPVLVLRAAGGWVIVEWRGEGASD